MSLFENLNILKDTIFRKSLINSIKVRAVQISFNTHKAGCLMQDQKEVLFIFIGKSLPKYASHSLKLAVKTSGVSVRLIGDKNFETVAINSGAAFTPLESFYLSNEFMESSKNISLPHSFRDGFWLKTLERFFVIKQFMEFTGASSVFHAELDQILFQCDELVDKLTKTDYQGLFLPFHSPDKAIASIFYCNRIDYLNNFLAFSCESKDFQNEMEMLADWAKKNTDKVFALPTLATELGMNLVLESLGLKVLSSNEIGGIVDGAQLGQWIGGEDPRNLLLRDLPTNHYFETSKDGILTENQLSDLFFKLNLKNVLYCQTKTSGSFKLYNLHLHSKIHAWITRSDKNLNKLINLSNLSAPKTLPLTRRIKINYLFKTAVVSFINDPIGVVKRQLGNLKFF